MKLKSWVVIIAFVLPASRAAPANADIIYTYSGFPLQAQTGSALEGQGAIFSFITPSVLPDNMIFGGPLASPAVPVISWTAAAGPFASSAVGIGSTPNAPGLFDLQFATNSSGTITGWRLGLNPELATGGNWTLRSVAPLATASFQSLGVSAHNPPGCPPACDPYAGDFVQANPGPLGSVFTDLAVSITPGQWSVY